jgi:hypothetical protein
LRLASLQLCDGIEGHAYARKCLRWRDRLIAIAGEQVPMPHGEIDVDMLLERSEIWLPIDILEVQGEPRECHHNSMRLVYDGGADAWATGYALHSDRSSFWVQHSWAIRRTAEGGRVVETTAEKWRLYCGVVFTPSEFAARYKREFADRPPC